MSVQITTTENHTYQIDGVIIDDKRIPSKDLSSIQLSDAVINNCLFYTYKGQGAVELLVPGNVVRQVTIRYGQEGNGYYD